MPTIDLLFNNLDLVNPEKEEFDIIPNVTNNQDENSKSPEKETFDYDQYHEYANKNGTNMIYELLNEQNPEKDKAKEQRLKEIARWNSIGQGLVTLFDGIQGAQGARIPIRKDVVTPYALGSLDNMEKDYQAKKANIDNLKLSQMIRSVDMYNQDKKADDKFKKQKELEGYRNSLATNLEGLKHTNKLAATEDEYKKRANLERLKAKLKAQSQTGPDGKPYFQVTDETGTIYNVPEAQYYDILVKLQNDIEKEGIKDLDVLDLQYGDVAQKNYLNMLVTKYWNEYYNADKGYLAPTQKKEVEISTGGYY